MLTVLCRLLLQQVKIILSVNIATVFMETEDYSPNPQISSQSSSHLDTLFSNIMQYSGSVSTKGAFLSRLPEATSWSFIFFRLCLAPQSCRASASGSWWWIRPVRCQSSVLINPRSERQRWVVTVCCILLLSASWISRVVVTKNSMATRHLWHLPSQLLIVASAFFFYRENHKYVIHFNVTRSNLLWCVARNMRYKVVYITVNAVILHCSLWTLSMLHWSKPTKKHWRIGNGYIFLFEKTRQRNMSPTSYNLKPIILDFPKM